MSRYQTTFAACKEKNRAAFIPFWMLGDPDPAASQTIVETIAEHADILELGMPFSDPLADGPTIQASVNRSLEAGTTTEDCFQVIQSVRAKFADKPIGLLVYLNLILAFGVEKFFAECARTGVDSVLIPELPVEEVDLVKSAAETSAIDLVFLASTNTPDARLQQIYDHSGGFLYAVSTPSITGAKTDIAPATLEMIQKLKSETNLPICVGFGVSTPEQVQTLSQNGADGVIIGSKLFEFSDDLAALQEFCKTCQNATSRAS